MSSSEQLASREKDEQRWSALMKQSQAGNVAAYNQLLSEIGSVIEAYLRVHFGQLTMLEECVQESLLALHHARHTYDPKRAFRPWFFTLVHHKTIDVLRRCETANRVISDYAEFDHTGISDVDLDRVIDGERLMKQLSEEQRQAVELTKYLGMTTIEVSNLLGVRESTVKARLRRGLHHIKKQWQEALHQ
ncbi:MAG: hypothetical protein COA95_04955 [Methylophaga sp.]|nr:MAG: hypothetical protein COA95_04955 [Methylophaga sp.]